MDIQQIKSGALARRNAGDFAGAEAMFRQALAVAPDDVDCLHMLGVLCFRTGRAREAMQFFLHAGMRSDWQVPAIARNFGLAMSHVYGGEITVKRIAYLTWLNARQRRGKPVKLVAPRVTVVVPSYNHARFIGPCLESVYQQTWASIELIVIDDGSTDDSVERIRETLKSCPFPHQFIARENRGAHHTINEAIALANGEYVNILNSDDRFHPQRLEKMVARVAAIDADWGFAGVEMIDDQGERAPALEGSLASTLAIITATVNAAPTIGFALLRHNVAISTGNLFFRTKFFREIGGFSDLRYVHDQEFALRATLVSEPVYVADKLYEYRVHGSNTISEAGSNATAETAAMLHQHIQKLLGLSDSSATLNPFAPTRANWGEYVATNLLRYGFGFGFGFGGSLSPSQLADIAQRAMGGETQSITTLGRVEGIADALPLLELMSTPPSGVQATFDQFQRYGMVARVVEHLRRKGQTFTILEVGANTHRLLGQLLPHDKIIYLDREVPLEMQGANDVLVGDATDLNMADGAFDIVVALDVFEHIEPTQRADFLRHIMRVSRIATLLGAPFASAAVTDAENDACAFWDDLFAKPYRWLVEHAENGLPDLAATQLELAKLGMAYTHFGHGELTLWVEMMKAHFAAEASTALRVPMSAMDNFYRDNLLESDVGGEATYRQFLLCSRDATVTSQLAQFPASLKKNVTLPNVSALIDVLQAMQRMGQDMVRHTAQNRSSDG